MIKLILFFCLPPDLSLYAGIHAYGSKYRKQEAFPKYEIRHVYSLGSLQRFGTWRMGYE